jgi:hypothetical protein
MKTELNFTRAVFLVLTVCMAFWLCSEGHPGDVMSAQKPTEPLIAKDSIQVTLRTHHDYYRGGQRDESTWSWTPKIKYRVNGPIASGSQLSVEFTLPGNRPWVKFDCQTGAVVDRDHWWETECGNNDVPDEKAFTETGGGRIHHQAPERAFRHRQDPVCGKNGCREIPLRARPAEIQE